MWIKLDSMSGDSWSQNRHRVDDLVLNSRFTRGFLLGIVLINWECD